MTTFLSLNRLAENSVTLAVSAKIYVGLHKQSEGLVTFRLYGFFCNNVSCILSK